MSADLARAILALSEFGPFGIVPTPDTADMVCRRCGTTQGFRPRGDELQTGIPAACLVAWMRDHTCPEDRRPVLRRVRELVATGPGSEAARQP
jgi:hypothetical protein